MKKAARQSKVKWLKYRLISSKDQYWRYTKIKFRLKQSGNRKHRDEIALLDHLILKWQYEQTERKQDPVFIIRMRKGINYPASHLAKDLGISKGHMSDILNYKKPLSKKMILKLAQYFNLPESHFSRPYRLKKAVAPPLLKLPRRA